MIKICLIIFSLLMSKLSSASIKAYFNHDLTKTYTDPYRGISRNGSNLEQVILDNIFQAKKSIYIAVQELRLPLIAKALVKKMNEGVDVRIVIEHDYHFTVLTQRQISDENEYESTRLEELVSFVDENNNGSFENIELQNRDAIFILKAAGVKIIDDTSDGSKGSSLMHHKFIVIDGDTTIVSTANFTLSCIHGDYQDEESRGNANSMVVITSKEVADIFEEEFSELWGNGIRGRYGIKKSYREAKTVSVKGKKLTIQFSPTSKKLNWEDSVNGLIAQTLESSRSSVKAALFVFSDQKISNALEEVHNSGSEISFFIEPKFAFRYYSELLDLFGIQMKNPRCVYENGNKPWVTPVTRSGMANLDSGDILHHKFAVVDDSRVIMGSQNWSDSANHLNDETILVIEDSRIANEYIDEFERIESTSFIGVPNWVYAQIQTIEKECF
jgi:phosphatidylserine/phosphatidylglycerophosphate/cardiolipin synthase-like enzyme